MEWHTSKPPIEQEIEFDKGDGQIERGTLVPNDFGIADTLAEANRQMREQYQIKGNRDRSFDVVRWRELP